MELIVLKHLEQAFPILDQLRAAFVLIGPDLSVRYTNSAGRQLFGRRLVHRPAQELLGAAFDDICGPMLRGDQAEARWREIRIKSGDQAEGLDVAVRGISISFGGKTLGQLLVFEDISAEVAMHHKYRKLLDEQRQVNVKLRKEIAAKLREHEDDISQFSEILQIAPTIFGSFVTEANAAINSVANLDLGTAHAHDVEAALRAMHTLKGNARTLGLNFIGGRAHAVEELFQNLHDSRADQPRGQDNNLALRDLLQELRRAIERAGLIRQRLGEVQATPMSGIELEQYEELAETQALIQQALANIDRGHSAAPLLEDASKRLDSAARIPLKPLFEYLRVTATSTARNMGLEAPTVTTGGELIAVAPSVYRALSVALPHVVRNALTHGIEPADERVKVGKAPVGTIELMAHAIGLNVEIAVRDDGRGLQTERLIAAAKRRGLSIPQRKEDFVQLIAVHGISTAEGVTLEAGRGVGASAAKEAVEAIGGTLKFQAPNDGGLLVTLTVPASPIQTKGTPRTDGASQAISDGGRNGGPPPLPDADLP